MNKDPTPATETISMTNILDEYNGKHGAIPKQLNPLTGFPTSLVNIRAIVISQVDMSKYDNDGIKFAEACITGDYKRDNYKRTSYHYIVTGGKEDRILSMLNIPNVALHANFDKYSKFAVEYFGELICPVALPGEIISQTIGPDKCTIGICVQKPSNEEEEKLIMERLIQCTAYVMNVYCKHILEPEANIFNVERLHQEQDELDIGYLNKIAKYRVEVDKLRTKWLAHYKENNRGYPNLDLQIITLAGIGTKFNQ